MRAPVYLVRSFCNNDFLETAEHMFLSCPRVHAMLDAVSRP